MKISTSEINIGSIASEKNSILIIKGIKEAEFYVRNITKIFFKVYAVDTESYILIKKNRKPVILLSDVLSKENIDYSFKEGLSTVNLIDKKIIEKLILNEINLFKYFKYNYFEYISELIALKLTIESILLEHSSSKIYALNSSLEFSKINSFHAVDINIIFFLYSKNSTLVNYLEYEFKRRNRLILLSKNIKIKLMEFIRGVINLLHMNNSDFTNSVVAVGSGGDAIITYELANYLFPKSKIIIAANYLQYLSEITNSIDGLLKCKLISFDKISSNKFINKNKFKNFENKFIEVLSDIHDELIYLHEHKAMIYKKAIKRTLIFEKILKRFAGSKFVITNMNSLDERIIEQAAKNYSIEIISCPHGWIAEPEGYEYKADKYFCRSSLESKILSLNNKNLQIQKYDQSINSLETIPNKLSVLVLSTGARNERILNEFCYQRIYSYWKELIKFSIINNNIKIYVSSKKQPFDSHLVDLFSMDELKNIIFLEGSIENKLSKARIIVDFGKPSSATYYAIKLGKPILICNNIYKFSRPLNSMIFDLYEYKSIKNPSELFSKLQEFVENPLLSQIEILKDNKILRDIL
jgi:hypothetical protein